MRNSRITAGTGFALALILCFGIQLSSSAQGQAKSGRVVSPVSGLPELAAKGVKKPSGAPGDLTILNWAGFQSAMSLTFDDGQPSQIQHYAELNALGVPLTFYVASGWASSDPKFDSTWAQAFKDGHEIGDHTVHHPRADLSSANGTALSSQLAEIDENAAYFKAHFGQAKTWSFAAPWGDSGWAEYAKARYFVNRGVNGGTIPPNDEYVDPYNLPAVMIGGNEETSDIVGQIDFARDMGEWVIFLYHSILPGANWYAGIDMSVIAESVTTAKSYGDLWIDTLARVAAYWIGQKTLSAIEPTKSGSTLTWTWKLPEHFPTGMYLRVVVAGKPMQNGKALPWNEHGYYEIALDAGSLRVEP